MTKENQKLINKKMELLEELVKKQQEGLDTAKLIINSSDKLLNLYEDQTEMYKKSNNRLLTSLLIMGAIFVVSAVLNLINLFT
jgi:coenzyme F420-reducing hydrogenase alpha subunit